ncbi:AAA domain-containing protein [Couchioplanes azureus]|uniref:AAA domain-containing protein n=1 Tax=Couchioplanes caeruleus TaxID=56438 RepID=UPI00167109A1|nr:AAA domain-containing protein [Couchioplanes caeruleus]GGQ64326.1 very short patch repair endonuclease [Couchioplanes caeruleus subsp. azureus]
MPEPESPTVIRDRAVSVADYLLGVRAHMERPARTVPADAWWLEALPAHPACGAGPAEDGTTWLRVGLPDLPGPPPVPAELRRRLTEVTPAAEPMLTPEPAPQAPTPQGSAPHGSAPHGSAPHGSAPQGPASQGATPEVPKPQGPATDGQGPVDDGGFAAWRDEVWRPWSLLSRGAEQTRTLHRRLFDLMHQVDMAAASTELVWGHGILETVVDGQRVRYPLVATPVVVEYAPDRSLITVSPQGPSRLQTDALAGLDERYLAQLVALAGPAGTIEADLWDDLERRELFERALGRLGYDRIVVPPGHTDTGPGTVPPGPRIVDTGVLFARPRQRLLRGFLENLRDRLLAGDTAGVGALAAIVAHEPSRLQMPGDRPEQWRRVGERLLMPLPTNEAQESIARRLALHRNVAVQGPPGTGKTHTIRNLICHLMANGKRVLVVAQKEDPLRVLRDGLPEEVRALCLAVLGRTTDQLVQLQLAARELSDRAATLDKDAEAARVERLTGRLEEAERELDRALGGLRAIAEGEAATYRIDDADLSPAEVGAWLRERAAAHGGIPDAVDPYAPPPLTADECAVLLELAATLPPADRAAALRDLPEVADLPDAARAKQDRADRAAAAERVSRLAAAGVDPDPVRAHGSKALADLRDGLRDAVAWLRRREGTWTDRLGRLLSDPHWASVWADHVAATEELQRSLADLTRRLAGHRIAVPPALAAEPKRLLATLAEVRGRFAAGKGLHRLLQASLWKVADEVRVDGEPLRTVDDVDLAMAWMRRSQARRRLGEHWAEWIRRLDVPRPEGDPEVWTGGLLAEAMQSLAWDARHWPEISARLAALVPQEELELDAARLAEISALLDDGPVVFELDRWDAGDRAVAEGLARWPRLAEAWRTLDGWDEQVAEVERLRSLRPHVSRYVALRDRLAAAAPEWAAQIDDGAVPAVSATACARAWRWRQAQTWFDQVVGSVDPAVLNRRVEQGRERIRRLTGELVVASAWLEVARALDDRRRAALADWTTALRKIGKGTGRSAAAWQAHAQRAMASAVEAVPVWVMSVDRAIEQFAGGARFDVVIVDEASQADLFALPVLSLAERAVVVGDDQQIGPQLGFVGPVAGLIHTHLGDVPSAEHFDPESSLYDHAVRRSPERILLTEHFRCVPQIIEFSSRHYYDGKIQPLRADRSALDPVAAVFVADGVRRPRESFGDVNLAEAEALVDRVARIVADPAYRGRSLGVISLLSSSGQASYLLSRLRETIGEDEMEARRLRVGDAYTFQGDERDVVLVSMVVSDNDGRPAAFTKRDYHRRINVAASRARDQLWIFHSVRPSSLLPDDARALLLNYALNLTASGAQADAELLCESDLERAVLRHLVARGYRPTPQFRIGGYRIDFVLNAPDGRRLAIECDGEAYQGPAQWASDMRRQAVLERVGNCVFVRIRGSIFAREPDAALRPLWQRIEELGITA